eukprot:superscaffoldBa00009015_g23799
MSFCCPLPCWVHSPPSPLRVAAREAPESRQHTESRIHIAPPGVILIRLLSWSGREEENSMASDADGPISRGGGADMYPDSRDKREGSQRSPD